MTVSGAKVGRDSGSMCMVSSREMVVAWGVREVLVVVRSRMGSSVGVGRESGRVGFSSSASFSGARWSAVGAGILVAVL